MFFLFILDTLYQILYTLVRMKNTSFEFCIYDKHLPQDWDAFMLKNRFGSVHQISDWAKFQKQIPGRGNVYGFAVRNPETQDIIAATLCVRMETGFFSTFWWYSPRGPVFHPKKNAGAGRFLMNSVSQELQKTGAIFWRLDPYFSSLDMEFLNVQGFVSATQDYQPTDTLEIDLLHDDDILLGAMKRKGRYNIKLAQKKDLKLIIKEHGQFTNQDVEDFWNLNRETTSRDGFMGHQKDYYRHFLTHLKDVATLFFIETPDGTRIATAISTFCGTKAIYYFGASTSDPQYRKLMAPYLLQWKMIQYAKKKGCETYDFLGIAPEGQPKHTYAGISEFKWKFGGYRKTYDHGKEKVFSSFWYIIYRLAKMIRG